MENMGQGGLIDCRVMNRWNESHIDVVPHPESRVRPRTCDACFLERMGDGEEWFPLYPQCLTPPAVAKRPENQEHSIGRLQYSVAYAAIAKDLALRFGNTC